MNSRKGVPARKERTRLQAIQNITYQSVLLLEQINEVYWEVKENFFTAV